MKLFTLLIGFLIPVASFSNEVPVVIRHLDSPYIMPRNELIGIAIPHAKILLEGAGVRARFVVPATRPNNWTRYTTNPYVMGPLLYRVRQFFLRRDRNTSARIYIAAVGPFIEPSLDRWMLGLASNICSYRRNVGYAFATVQSFNLWGEDRRRHSGVVLAHEIGHLLGAKHDDLNPNVMHSLALSFVSGNPDMMFNEKANREMRDCITRLPLPR